MCYTIKQTKPYFCKRNYGGYKMARQERKWHTKFNEYMQFIVKHQNYKEIPSPYKEDGSIRWVVAGNSSIGRGREAWWDSKREKLNVEKKPGWKALVARKIHPTGEKPCQICGRVMSLDYIYPNKTCPYHKDTLAPCNKEKCDYFKKESKCSHLGPGAMSDAPDRFDGFHTYNRCCRSREDTGRHADNLRKYGEDRRVYEFWVEGDWKTASWLMKLYSKSGVSADHIGPISLGFCHRPKFRPMTKRENIAKGNRMTHEDVQELIKDEESGEQVVSWHSSFIWKKIEHLVKNDSDAEKLSNLMRKNLHKILSIFYIIHSKGFDSFLIRGFLHPEYALFQPIFENFDPKTGTCSISRKKVNRTEHRRNAERYIRKSFEELEKYQLKDNRKITSTLGIEASEFIKDVLTSLNEGDENLARKNLAKVFEVMAGEALEKFILITNE